MGIAAGQILRAADLPPAVDFRISTSFSLTTTGGDFIVGGESGGLYVDCAVLFTAPTSGRVILRYGARMSVDGTSRTLRIEPEVREGSTVGSGTIMFTPVGTSGLDYVGLTGNNTGSDGSGSAALTLNTWGRPLENLTPGQVYNARLFHRMSSTGNAFIADRMITAEPIR